jgi:hypothetical protein
MDTDRKKYAILTIIVLNMDKSTQEYITKQEFTKGFLSSCFGSFMLLFQTILSNNKT